MRPRGGSRRLQGFRAGERVAGDALSAAGWPSPIAVDTNYVFPPLSQSVLSRMPLHYFPWNLSHRALAPVRRANLQGCGNPRLSTAPEMVSWQRVVQYAFAAHAQIAEVISVEQLRRRGCRAPLIMPCSRQDTLFDQGES